MPLLDDSVHIFGCAVETEKGILTDELSNVRSSLNNFTVLSNPMVRPDLSIELLALTQGATPPPQFMLTYLNICLISCSCETALFWAFATFPKPEVTGYGISGNGKCGQWLHSLWQLCVCWESISKY